jgi:hypothetical protein
MDTPLRQAGLVEGFGWLCGAGGGGTSKEYRQAQKPPLSGTTVLVSGWNIISVEGVSDHSLLRHYNDTPIADLSF